MFQEEQGQWAEFDSSACLRSLRSTPKEKAPVLVSPALVMAPPKAGHLPVGLSQSLLLIAAFAAVIFTFVPHWPD